MLTGFGIRTVTLLRAFLVELWGLSNKFRKHLLSATWEIPWTEEPSGLQSRGVTKELDMTENVQQRKKN